MSLIDLAKSVADYVVVNPAFNFSEFESLIKTNIPKAQAELDERKKRRKELLEFIEIRKHLEESKQEYYDIIHRSIKRTFMDIKGLCRYYPEAKIITFGNSWTTTDYIYWNPEPYEALSMPTQQRGNSELFLDRLYFCPVCGKYKHDLDESEYSDDILADFYRWLVYSNTSNETFGRHICDQHLKVGKYVNESAFLPVLNILKATPRFTLQPCEYCSQISFSQGRVAEKLQKYFTERELECVKEFGKIQILSTCSRCGIKRSVFDFSSDSVCDNCKETENLIRRHILQSRLSKPISKKTTRYFQNLAAISAIGKALQNNENNRIKTRSRQ